MDRADSGQNPDPGRLRSYRDNSASERVWLMQITGVGRLDRVRG